MRRTFNCRIIAAGGSLVLGLLVVRVAAAASVAAPPAVVEANRSVIAAKRVDQSFAIAAAMASRLRAMAAAASPAAVRQTPPGLPQQVSAASTGHSKDVHTGRSALRNADAHQPRPQSADWLAICTHFRTYAAATGTYRGYDGKTHRCGRRDDNPPAPDVAKAPPARPQPQPNGGYAMGWQ